MKLLFDLFPVILFFIVFKVADVFAATAAAMLATFAQVAWVKYRHGKVDAMLWVSLGLISVFGGATLLLHDETFIKWKPTILYWFFAIALLCSALLFKKNLIRSMLQEKITLPDVVWDRLNLSWSAFFTLLGMLNLFVAYSFSTDTWVNFKLFGATGLMLVFVIAQSVFLAKYGEKDKTEF